jgi:hypothetical protein
MKRAMKSLCFAFATLLAFSVLSFAEDRNNAGVSAPAAQQEPQPQATGFTTNAKVAYYYSRGFATARSKNVSHFSNPSTGVYCIKPSVALNFSKIYPLLSIEWGTSDGFALLAYWRDIASSSDCPAGELEIQTYDFNAGGYPVASGNVSFSFVIE